MKAQGYTQKATVRTIPTRILVGNPRRLSYTLKNDDTTTDFYYGNSQNVATSGFHQGIKVSAGGMGIEERFNTSEVWAIASTEVQITLSENYLVEGEEPTPAERKV